MTGPDTPTTKEADVLDIRTLLKLEEETDASSSLELDRLLEYKDTHNEILAGLYDIESITDNEQIQLIIRLIRKNLQRNALQFLTSELALQARRSTDRIGDTASSEKVQKTTKLSEERVTTDNERKRFEKIVRKVLNRIIEFLKKVSDTPPIGVGFTFQEPLKGETNKIQEGPIRQDIKYILGTQEEIGEDEYESQHDNERHLLLKMTFGENEGENEIGYMDFVFNGTEISPKTKFICRNIKEVFDTFLNNGLHNILMDRIQEAQEIISSKFGLLDWRKIMEEYMKILKKIGFDATLICKRFGPETEGACKITDNEATDFDEKSSTVNIINDQALKSSNEILELRLIPRNSETSVLMGALLFNSDDEKKTQLIAHIAKTLEEVIRRREELRESLIHNLTRKAANLYVDGKLEKLGKHEFVIMIGDMNGFSAWAERLKRDAEAGKYREALNNRIKDDEILAKIMGRFFNDVSIFINTETDGTLDDFIGDEVIAYFGPPFDNQGRDSKGKKDNERDIAGHINDALKLTERIQGIFDRVVSQFEQEFGINLGGHPIFSFGIKSVKDYVGIYGDFDRKYSRVKLTDIGTGINRTARTQSAAKNGATLVGYETWLQYKSKGQETDFEQVGPKYYFQGKNLQDPILVVQVLRKEKIEKQKAEQRSQVLNKKGSLMFWDQNNYNEIPDGDYICPMGPMSKQGAIMNLKLHLENDKEGFPVAIPREKISEIIYLIPDDEEQKLNQQGKIMGVPNDVYLRKIVNRFFVIRYENLEKVQCRALNEIIERNEKNGLSYVKFDDLVPGVYKLRGEKHDTHPDGDVLLKLKRGGRDVDVLVQSYEMNLLRFDTDAIPISGVVEFAEGFLNFKAET